LASARPVIGSVDVLVPKIAFAPIAASAFFVASAFTVRSSNTASITRIGGRERAKIIGGADAPECPRPSSPASRVPLAICRSITPAA